MLCTTLGKSKKNRRKHGKNWQARGNQKNWKEMSRMGMQKKNINSWGRKGYKGRRITRPRQKKKGGRLRFRGADSEHLPRRRRTICMDCSCNGGVRDWERGKTNTFTKRLGNSALSRQTTQKLETRFIKEKGSRAEGWWRERSDLA